MSYFDHMCGFADRAAALAAMPHLTDGEGGWIVPVFELLALITSEAAWEPLNPETGEVTLATPGESLPGYWLMVSLPAEDAALKASGACRLIASRALWREQSPFGFLTWLDWDLTEFETVLRFSPVIAGAGYPFGG